MADNEPSENDEIPPDTDIEKQYKENEQSEDNQNEQENEEEEEVNEENEGDEENEENEENQNEEEDQGYRNNEEMQNYNIQQQSQQYQATQYSQPPNSYQMLASNMQAQAQGQFQEGGENQYAYISHLNQNYQSLQPNQIYQPKMQNISQRLIQYGQEFSNSHENIFNAQAQQQEKPTVLEPIFVQVNPDNQGQNLLNQMNQQGQFYNNIINKRLLNQYGEYQSGQKSAYNQYSQEISQSSQFQGASPTKKDKKIKKMKQVKKEPKDNTTSKPSAGGEISKRNIASRFNRRVQQPVKKVTPLISFHDISSRKIKLKSNLNREKEDLSEFVEIPREQYHIHANNETLYFEGGMNTGQYKFRGEETVIKQDEKLGNVNFNEEELLEEISRRTSKKGKKVKYEIMDKFYSLTEFERKEKKDRRYFLNKSNENEIDNSKFSGSLENYLGFGGQSLNKTRSNIDQNMENQNQISIHMKTNIKNESGQNVDLNESKKIIKYNYKNKTTISPLDNYSRYLLEQINKIRIDPQSFIGVIEDAKANIKKYKYGGYIYEGRLKIALTSGEAAFNETIEYLKNLDSMEILEFCPLITIPVPQTEDDIKEVNYLKSKVDDMINDGINVKSFWRDVIKDPQISFLLMIVDDNGTRKGMRRKDILNPKMKYIGITSTEINGKFACYITLTNKLSIN